MVSTWATWFAASTVAILLLETATWAPVREPRDQPTVAHAETTPVSRRDGRPGGRRSPTVVEGSVIVFITVACGISPAFFGFYRVSVWGPIALFLLAALLALVLARPSAPRRTALVAVGGLVVPLALVAALHGLGRVGRPGADSSPTAGCSTPASSRS